MIRLIQRRLIIPRGDTGTFTVPALSPGQSDSVGVFTIFDPITKTRVFQKQVELQDGVFNIEFDHGDTVNLQAGDYLWDIKFYVNPIIENGKVIDGTEIDSYYAAFQTPKCEIRETGDDFMVIDGQPAKIEDLNIILAATSAANAAKVAATEQAEIAATKASEAAERLAQMIAAIPTKVSELENDSGYLQEETDPTVPAWAKAQTKPSYTPQEVGALPSDTFIPSKVSDLTDDSGHYIKPANGIPASDLEETYLTQHQDISMKANSADLAAVATSGDYSDLANTPYIPTKTSDLVNDSSYPVDANYIHTDNNYTTAEKEKLAGIAAGAKVNVNADWNAISGDAQILNKPTNVSAFTNDAGYLTEHQDISGKADKSEIPTQVSELENDAGYLTSFTETDPTVPAWAKEPNKPAYTAAEINAVNKTGDTMTGALTLPYISQSYRNALRFGTNSNTLEMGINARYDQNYDYGYFTVSSERTSGFTQDAIIRGVKNPRYSNDAANKEYVDNKISTAIGNINSFDMAVVQELPTQDISTHTIYLVPKTGETNDVYDEYVYINDAWEMVGNTQIDLSDYALKSEIPTKVSELNNDSGYLTSYTETDPTVPQWAKASTKPSYTAVEVGALPSDTHIPSTTAELTNDAGFITSSALPTKVSDLTNDAGYLTTHQDISGKANAADLATVATSGSYNDLSNKPTIPEVPVQDVQVNGTSVLTNGVANIPGASTNNFGVIRVNSLKGTTIDNMGDLVINGANENYIKQARTYGEVINPANQHWATFYGLARIAGDTTQSNSTNSSGTYTPEAKGAIQSMLGVSDLIATEENNLIASKAYAIGDVFTANGKLYKATAAIAVDAAIITDGANANCEETSVGDGFVKFTDKATSTTPGLVRFATNAAYGIWYKNAPEDDVLRIACAGTNEIKAGNSSYMPIVPASQHTSIFYGLSKLAGIDLASETVTVGTYPTTSQAAIRTMLGATSSNVIAVQDTQPTDTDTKIWLPETAPEGVEVPTMADMNAALAGKVGDVTINGTSVVSNGVANIPIGSTSNYGVFRVASETEVKEGVSLQRLIAPGRQASSVFYGLATAAGDTTMTTSSNAVGTYTYEAQLAIRNMLGVPGYPMANSMKLGSDGTRIISPSVQHEAVFYGLSKVAGVDLANETVTLGTYPETSKTAIRSLIGAGEPLDVQVNGTSVVSNGVANIPIATTSTFGAVKCGTGLSMMTGDNVGKINTNPASTSACKNGAEYYAPITPNHQHESTFYGLAKAAGDTTQSASSNAVGVYTNEAKTAIQQMLGIDLSSIASQVEIPLVETVTGTDITINGQPNVRYNCGEVSTITINPPAAGSIDVIFTSGTSVAVLTLPSIVKMPAWFDATILETDTIYEILITDGVYGSVMTWPV